MTPAWTARAYALFRVTFGLYLAVHFAYLVPWGPELFSSKGVLPAEASPLLRLFPNVLLLSDAPLFVKALLCVGVLAALALAAGRRDRAAALLLWYLWACLFGRNPLIGNPGLPYVGLLLLTHAAVPPRPKPGEGEAAWRVPPALYAMVWALLALGYSYSGAYKLFSPSWLDGSALRTVLEGPLARPGAVRDLLLALPPLVLSCLTWGALALEVLFLPLSLVRRVRPLLWVAMLAMHLGLIVLLDFADLSLGMVMLHLFTLDPAWVPPARPGARELVFFDGACGMCHGFVRFALEEDQRGDAFQFAPLHGETFQARVPPALRTGLPDSIGVLTERGALLTRSAALLHVLRRLGGVWRVVAAALWLVPPPLRNAAYDAVARQRARVAQAYACPLPGPRWRAHLAP